MTTEVETHEYDVVIVGAGGAGLRAAIAAREAGMRTAIADMTTLGYIRKLPDGVVDRPADVWEPLLAIAQAIHVTWAARAAAACVHLVGENRAGLPSLNITLLDDLRAVFTAAGTPRAIPTAALIEALRRREESPWADMRGKPLDPAGLARRLRGFDISSVNLRIGAQVVKGYRLADFHDPWTRYLPPVPGNAATPLLPPGRQLREEES